MQPRISIITLGVEQLDRAKSFYEQLGWKASGKFDEIAFFQAGGMVLALYGKEALAKDAHLEIGTGFGGITLAQNVESPEVVDEVMEQAKLAGAKILKPAQKVFWGGYSGYFSDLDGHAWEIAWNPHFKLDAQGNVSL